MVCEEASFFSKVIRDQELFQKMSSQSLFFYTERVMLPMVPNSTFRIRNQ